MFVNIPENIRNKRVLVRVDFNEPLLKGKIVDSFRIRRTVPTIRKLAKRVAKIVLISHIEDPVNKKQLSFKKICPEIARLLGLKVLFTERLPTAADRIFKESRVILLENIRFQKGETENDASFARSLASIGDIYINEAFSVSHRRHASIVGIPRYLPSFAGQLFREEVRALSEALRPQHPFLLIIGGRNLRQNLRL